MSPLCTIAKRVIDLVVAGAAMLTLSPLFIILFLIVRGSSKGSALFLQDRLGLNGKPFRLLKFRSMYENAPDLRNPDGSAVTSLNDPRVTPVGRFLRRTSLDELPQLINVLKGDMSLVGPRPDQVDQIRYYSEEEKRKLLVKPGITGLAQINGRNEIPWQKRKELDLEYVDRQSLWLDMQILLKTIPYVLAHRGVFTNSHTESAK
jgi:lipopolysaccharide/colanic/teichoic acid biosynthesis glycosyltransferase